MLLPHQIQQKPFKKLLNFWSCAHQKAVLVRQNGPALKFHGATKFVPRLCSNRKSRRELHSIAEASWATTKSSMQAWPAPAPT
jgi:hypothetical protein